MEFGFLFNDSIFPYQKRFNKLPPCYTEFSTSVKDIVTSMNKPHHDQPDATPVSPPCQAEFSASVKDNVISVDITINRSDEKENQQFWNWEKMIDPLTGAPNGISAKMY